MKTRMYGPSTMLALALALIAAGAAYAGPGAHGPNGEHLDTAPVTMPGAISRLPDGSVSVPVPAQRRWGLRTVLATASDAAAAVELPGQVVMDPNAGGRVQALAGGKLLPGPRGLPVAGQAVRQGEVLAYVAYNASPVELANQQAQLAQVRASRQLAAQRLQRLESLEGTVPRKEIEAARSELQGLGAQERALSGSVGAREALVAPVNGVVASAMGVAGQVVEPRDVLFEVVDPARVLVEARTPDAALGSQLAGAALAGLPAVKLRFLGAARSLRDGTLPLTFRATGPGPLPLAIGQPVTVVASLRQTVRGHVLPAQAVTRSPANETVVWVKAGAERFVAQPVQVQPLDARTVVVTQGLGPDNRVVVQGASLIAQVR
ncbi:efflux RND transporter periplasmic adaptor subunit [Ideonella sp.]|uniref:efflux RND transporter periplasmic adaptor subunit n=1 Tax=Ideonella sp. TaxID=1929293 RepID=UPI0035AFEA71